MTVTGKDKLQLQSDHSSLGVARAAWTAALKKVEADPIANIRHAVIGKDPKNEGNNLHVAEIPDRVANHVHMHGIEEYAVVQGEGTLYWGEVKELEKAFIVPYPEEPAFVKEGDSFNIPAGYAHQLKNEGRLHEPLVIIFSCPDSHLDNTQDRFMLPPLAPQ